MEARSLKSRYWQSWFLLRVQKENLFHASLLASGDGWQSWAFFGSVDVYHLNISLYPHGVFSLSLCSHVAIFWVLLFFKVFKKYLHLRICLLILERRRKRQNEGERRTHTYTSVWERNIDQLLPACTQTGDWTCHLLVYRMIFQPIEPLALFTVP